MFGSVRQSSISERLEDLHSNEDSILFHDGRCQEFDGEIDKSRGVYSFVPRSPLLKVIYETSDLNRDWKSCYFFLEGDG